MSDDAKRRRLIEDSERILDDALARHGFHGVSMNVVQILVKRDNEERDASTAIANLLFQYPQELAAIRAELVSVKGEAIRAVNDALAEVARLTAENERLTYERDVWKDKVRHLKSSYDKQLAALTERLAAAERLVEAADKFTFKNNLQMTLCNDGHWHIWMPGQPGKFTTNLKEGIEHAISANWLPQDEANGGGG